MKRPQVKWNEKGWHGSTRYKAWCIMTATVSVSCACLASFRFNAENSLTVGTGPPPAGPSPVSASSSGDDDSDDDDGSDRNLQEPPRISSPAAVAAAAAEVAGKCSLNQTGTASDTFSWRFIDSLMHDITYQGDGKSVEGCFEKNRGKGGLGGGETRSG